VKICRASGSRFHLGHHLRRTTQDRVRQQTHNIMKASLLQRWVTFVYRHSQRRVWPYSYLSLTIVLCILEILRVLHFASHSHVHFLLLMLLLTLLGFERLGFSELLMGRDREIERLLRESKASAQLHASPSGGPAEQFHNPGITGRPPSVG